MKKMKLIEVKELPARKRFEYRSATKVAGEVLKLVKLERYGSFESAKREAEKNNARYPNRKLFVVVDEFVNDVLVTSEVWGE